MAIAKVTPKKAATPEWIRCQYAIRKLLCFMGKDSLVYTKEILDYEDDNSDKLKVFWENARRFFDEYAPTPVLKNEKPEPAPEPVATPATETKPD